MTKTIVVIGASRGIGKELVHLFAQNSTTKVLAFSRNKKKMDECFGHLSNVETFSIDLTSSSVRSEMESYLTSIDKIDFVVNNAGFLVNKPFLELTHEDITNCYSANVMGVMQTTQAIVPKMNHGGHIVNISSMGGFQGSVKFAGLAAYSTSKAAICSFTELFAEEYKETSIKMNCLCLGAVQTEMLEEAFPGYEAPMSATEMASYIEDFTLNGHHYMNGKILPVSLSTP